MPFINNVSIDFCNCLGFFGKSFYFAFNRPARRIDGPCDAERPVAC